MTEAKSDAYSGEERMRDTRIRFAKIIVNLVLFILGVLFFVFVMPGMLGFFMPFVVGWIISLMTNPLVKFLEKRIKIKRKAGSAVVIIVVIGIARRYSYVLMLDFHLLLYQI